MLIVEMKTLQVLFLGPAILIDFSSIEKMDKWIIDILSHAIVSSQKDILCLGAHKFSDITLGR